MVVSRVRDMVFMWRRIIALSSKPSSDEYLLLLRLTLIGFTLIGGIGFAVHMIYILLTR